MNVTQGHEVGIERSIRPEDQRRTPCVSACPDGQTMPCDHVPASGGTGGDPLNGRKEGMCSTIALPQPRCRSRDLDGHAHRIIDELDLTATRTGCETVVDRAFVKAVVISNEKDDRSIRSIQLFSCPVENRIVDVVVIEQVTRDQHEVDVTFDAEVDQRSEGPLTQTVVHLVEMAVRGVQILAGRGDSISDDVSSAGHGSLNGAIQGLWVERRILGNAVVSCPPRSTISGPSGFGGPKTQGLGLIPSNYVRRRRRGCPRVGHGRPIDQLLSNIPPALSTKLDQSLDFHLTLTRSSREIKVHHARARVLSRRGMQEEGDAARCWRDIPGTVTFTRHCSSGGGRPKCGKSGGIGGTDVDRTQRQGDRGLFGSAINPT